MKTLSVLVVGVAALAGCAGRLPEPKQATMVRSFHGRLVPGYFVSPNAYERYLRAQLYANEGRAEEAAIELRHAIGSDGASAYLRTRLAEELLVIGRVDEAREEIEAALHLDPDFAEAYVDLGRVRARLGDGAGAETALRRALDLDSGCEDAYVLLVNLYHERGQERRVEETWRAYAAHVPAAAAAHEALGRAALARGDLKGAQKELDRALALDGNLIEARQQLAELYIAEGRADDALQALSQAFARSGDNKTAERLVRLYIANGRVAEARELCERLDEEAGSSGNLTALGVAEKRLWVGWRWLDAHAPERAADIAAAVLRTVDKPAAHLLYGKALAELGQQDEARAQLEKITPRALEYVTAQSLLGRLFRDQGRYHDAVEQLGRALVQVAAIGEPSSASDALVDLLAEVHERAGERSAAIKLLEQAYRKRPQSQALGLALGAIYQRDGQLERALDVGRQILRKNGDDALALNFVGYALCEQGQRLDEARRLLERALSLRPMSGAIADSLGWLYLRMSRLDDAERMLTRADRLAPSDPEILWHLGELYVKRADRARAAETYRRALKVETDERARHALEERLILIETGKLVGR